MTNRILGFECDGVVLPSVSAILKSDSKHKTNRKSNGLRNSEKQSAYESFATERGLAVHAAARSYLRDGEADLEEKFFPFFRNIQSKLEILDLEPYWAEEPVIPQLMHLKNNGCSAVWDNDNRYCGTPDYVGKVGGVPCVIEFKTSDNLYQTQYHKDFKTYNNWFKFSQAAMQSAAYANAFSKTTGIEVNTAIIIVATRDEGQLFILEGEQFIYQLTKFHKLAKEYHSCPL